MLILKGRVIDGNGGEPIERGLVAIEGERITAVCNDWEYPIPQNAEVIEIEDGTILPGFIDQHVHMGVGDDFYRIYQRHAYHGVCECVRDMRQILDAGFTSIRECGGISNYLKAPWEEGLIDGPRIFSSGKCIAQSGGHFDFIKDYPIEFTKHPDRNITTEICDGVDNVRRTARMHFREKCDFLKVMGGAGTSCQGNKLMTREFSDEELRAFVQEAQNYGTYVAIHAHGTEAIKAGLRAGVRSVEHGTFIDEEGIEMMVRQGAWLIPTLATSYLSWQHIDERAPWVKEKERLADECQERTLRMAYEAGVTICCGADLGGGTITVHGNNGLEFPLLVEKTGMSPMEAIVAGTKTGSKLLLMEDEIGTLTPGKLADVVVCQGDPLADIWKLSRPENIKVVVQGGRIKKHIS
ncbi:amidohydrolase family protein [Harryflintia acetispora]|uniref:amidohydrolase family protein n=1 Tax=Harryflintia acetispora TaxID=1849041 RepID=UPI0018979B31|nr:amidohydrolase family protein [Harryflintia acetispora]